MPYLELSISRSNSIELQIYRIPTYTDIMIHHTSNNPHNHKLPAFTFYINKIISLPITRQATNREWHRILTMDRNNGFPEHIIDELKKKLIKKKKVTQTNPTQKQSNKWITFTFHGSLLHKVTNLFPKTALKIAFRHTNTLLQQIKQRPKNNNPSGIYQLKCNSCNRAYVGQSDRAISLRHKEHLRYIRNNNAISAYAMYILHNRHQVGPADETLKLLKPCNKGIKMNCWEVLCMDMHCKEGLLIPEKQVTDTNPLFDLATIPRDLQATSPNSSSQPVVPYTHTTGEVQINFVACYFIIKLVFLAPYRTIQHSP